MCVCLCVAPKLYEKSEFANATDTNMTFATETIYASCIFMYIYIHIYMAYDIVSMYLNIRNKSDFAATEHLCLERIHWPSKLLMYKYFHLAISWLVCVTNVNTRPAFYGRSRSVFCQDVTVLES